MRLDSALGVLALAATAFACTSYQAIDPPDRMLSGGTAAKSDLLVIVRKDSMVESIDAIDLDKPEYPTIRVAPEEPADLYAFLYADALDALRVHPGSQTILAPPVKNGSYLLPAGAAGKGSTLGPIGAAYRMHLAASAEPKWEVQDLTATPPEITALAIDVPPATSCVDFTPVTLPLDTMASSLLGVSIDRSSALAGTEDGHFFRVTTKDAVRLTQLSTSTPALGGYRDPRTSQLWLIGKKGRIAFGTAELGFTPKGMTASGLADTFADLVGPGPGPTLFELFAATDRGTLDHSDGQTWTTLYSHPAANPVLSYAARAAWAGLGEAYAVIPTEAGVLHAMGGEVTQEPLPTPDEVATSVAVIPNFGPVAGSNKGKLWMKDGRTWKEIAGSPLTLAVTVIVPLDQGILFGGKAGVLSQYHPAIGFCPPQGYAPFDVRNVVPIDDAFMLTTLATHETITIPVVILNRRR